MLRRQSRRSIFKKVYKPSSVVYGHLSTNNVTVIPQRYFLIRSSETPKERIVNLASGGVYTAPRVTAQAVSFYLAFSSLPLKTAVIFCCTFLKVASTGISPAPCF